MRIHRSALLVSGCTLGLLGLIALTTGLGSRDPATTATARSATELAGEATSALSWSDDDTAGAGTDDATAPAADDTVGQGATETFVQTTALAPHLPPEHSGVVGIGIDGTTIVATGLVIDQVVVTSSAALNGAATVQVHHNGHVMVGTVRGVDPFNDLAVIEVTDPSVLPLPPQLGDDTEAEPGASVLLLAGNGGDELTAISGHVSGRGNVVTARGHTIYDALMTTVLAPELGPGAGVFTPDGHLIAMVVSCDSHLANAVSVTTLRSAAESIITTGWAHSAWLGLEGHGIPDTDPPSPELPRHGILVLAVDPQGPAAAAGLVAGDLLIAANEEPVWAMADLVRVVRSVGPGATVTIDLIRADVDHRVIVEVGQRAGT